jgi:hypothetical protein
MFSWRLWYGAIAVIGCPINLADISTAGICEYDERLLKTDQGCEMIAHSGMGHTLSIAEWRGMERDGQVVWDHVQQP